MCVSQAYALYVLNRVECSVSIIFTYGLGLLMLYYKNPFESILTQELQNIVYIFWLSLQRKTLMHVKHPFNRK